MSGFPSLLSALLLAIVFAQPAYAHPGTAEAVAYVDRLIAAQPRSQELYIQRGMIQSNDGRFAQALADFSRAQELGDPLAVGFELGVLHYRMRDFPTAKRYLDTWLARLPDHVPALEYRARLARETGDHAAALADFRRLLALQQRPNPAWFIEAAEMLAAPDGAGIAEALAVLDEGNRRLGITPQVQRKAIELERRRRRPDLAVARMQAMIAAFGETPDMRVELGELLVEAGRRPEALPQFRAAIAEIGALRDTPARRRLRARAEAQLAAAL